MVGLAAVAHRSREGDDRDSMQVTAMQSALEVQMDLVVQMETLMDLMVEMPSMEDVLDLVVKV